MIKSLSANELNLLLEKIQAQLKKNTGIGIGQSSVLSKKIHLYQSTSPEHIQIISNADAGKFFYGQIIENRVFHLDVFHQCGKVNHHKAALKVIEAINQYSHSTSLKRNLPNPDLFDIQTATGGGRITGTLEYGTKATLCRTHQNHLHLAFSLSLDHLACLFFLVHALEQVILDHQLGLRRLEKITTGYSDDNQFMNLSDYADKNDSALRKQNGKSATSLAMNESSKSTAPACGDETQAKQNTQNSNTLATTGQKSEQQTLLGFVNQRPDTYQLQRPSKASQIKIPKSLHNIIWKIKNYLKRKPLHSHPPIKNLATKQSLLSKKTSKSSSIVSTQLDIIATIHHAAIRQINEHHQHFAIHTDDLAFHMANTKSHAELCLLLDVSASMGGWRIEAAKELILKLHATTAYKISIITFHNQNATVVLPFTRDKQKLINALTQLEPCGATPLALGFKVSLQYLNSQKLKRPFLFLITDGLPCYTSGNLSDPLQDALSMAQKMKQQHIHFSCIGLNEKQDYLHHLAKAAGGQVFTLI